MVEIQYVQMGERVFFKFFPGHEIIQPLVKYDPAKQAQQKEGQKDDLLHLEIPVRSGISPAHQNSQYIMPQKIKPQADLGSL